METELIRKYNVAGPRYTSYPTVPYWDNSPGIESWLNLMKETFISTNSNGISLYIHLPYCESLCTYCGCNTRITVNHSVELPYIQAVLKEWKMYTQQLPGRPKIREIHLGGGTPTFFKSENLKLLIDGILSESDIAENFEFGFEGHPNYTSEDQLLTLYKLGFRRVSFGVQDFDPKVQSVINRIQSVEQVRTVTNWAKNIGYTSVNYDLIYGLPLQTQASIKNTIFHVRELQPHRIAFYSYAHVPWVKPGQRRFTELDLPSGEEKRNLYELGRAMLEDAGYVEIGMDHFALKSDTLFEAYTKNNLHRNFMGYTTNDTKLLIGLGVSSISDSWNCFVQNVKVVEQYVKLLNGGSFPILKGHILSAEDLEIRKHIQELMCNFETSWTGNSLFKEMLGGTIDRLKELKEDGLLKINNDKLIVTEKGRPFVRNICMAFDQRLWARQPDSVIFSSTV